jgi:hypothetical protein
MPILTAKVLKGLPGDNTQKILNYSPEGKDFSYEGVVIIFEDDKSHVWIGNFDDKHHGSGLAPHISTNGTAVVFAGPNLYILKDSEPATIRSVANYGGDDDWVQSCRFSQKGAEFLIAGSFRGKIIVLDNNGDQRAQDQLVVCEGLRFSVTNDFLVGKYFEFNLNKWIDFKLTLPELRER